MALRRVLSPRGVLVAMGVPVAFAAVAAALTFGTPISAAQAAPNAQPASVVQAASGPVPAAVAPGTRQHDYSVRRTAVLDPKRMVHRAFRVDTEDRVGFITIDDGIVKDRAALGFVRERSLPVTAFLSTWTIKNEAPYFSALTAWGSIQNHSATHANFAKSSTDLQHEICYSQRMLKETFGTKPWMLRPPYGAGSREPAVLRKAYECGVSEIVLWDAYVYKGKLSKAASLRPGSIVLLHFSKHLARDLRVAVNALHDAGLRPANLAEYVVAKG